MIADDISIKYIGGPTAYFEAGGLRFLTDPTFDLKGTKYDTGLYVLHKLGNPSITVDKIGKIDVVLLSHDHHFDNLDNEGRKLLSTVDTIYTTVDGAQRLGANAVGLENWQTVEVSTRNNKILTITGTPCRHGPIGGDRGPVTGFVLNYKNEPSGAVYITGDTVWYEGVQEVAKRFNIKMVVLFLGAAIVPAVGSAYLTMTVDESVKVAELFEKAMIIPLHFEGWEHFTESKEQIEKKYKEAGLINRLRWAKSYP